MARERAAAAATSMGALRWSICAPLRSSPCLLVVFAIVLVTIASFGVRTVSATSEYRFQPPTPRREMEEERRARLDLQAWRSPIHSAGTAWHSPAGLLRRRLLGFPQCPPGASLCLAQ